MTAAAVVAVVVAVLVGGRLLAGNGDGDGVTDTPRTTPAKCSEAGPMTGQPDRQDPKAEQDEEPCR